MSRLFRRPLVAALSAAVLHLQAAQGAQEAHQGTEVRAYANDSCIIADEPFFLPAAKNDDQSTAKFLPLLGLVIGKLAELFINHEIQASAEHMKSGAARKDTRYAAAKEMNLYRAEFAPAPALHINARLGCLTIVAAAFKADPADCTAGYIPKELSPESRSAPQDEWKTSRTDDSIENQLRRGNVCVDGKPKAVYEARFEFSADGTAYRLRDAGYRIDSLLTTDDRHAVRTTLYTLKISNPAATDQQETLSSAWVNIGPVSAGARSDGSKNSMSSKSEASPWLLVPPMSIEARRVYETRTNAHQEVMGAIEALRRAQTRNLRQLTALDERIAAATGEVADGLKQERTRLAVQSQSQAAELEARNAEYQDLPRAPLEFMPVKIEVAVTESESEKKARLALADILGKNGDMVASAVGNAASGLLSKSVQAGDLKLEPEPADSADALQRSRAQYFDAVLALRTAAPGAARESSQLTLDAAKDEYNQNRRSIGLEPVK
jgi:hypothetical protein